MSLVAALPLPLSVFIVYLLVGLPFGLLFVFWLVNFLDPHAKGAGIGFRLMILPTSIVLWGLLFFIVLFRGVSYLFGKTREQKVEPPIARASE